jgi:hypothetical protein
VGRKHPTSATKGKNNIIPAIAKTFSEKRGSYHII